MNKLLPFLGLVFLFAIPIQAQPNFTANNQIPNLTTPFRFALNPGYYGNSWTNEDIADLAVNGLGAQSLRATLPEDLLEEFGYNHWESIYSHYASLNLLENTVFLQNPSPAHRDPTEYCPGQQSLLFANMYEPIWDNGANGTPINENNYAALYVYQTVNIYKNYIKFWEIWNEPDLGGPGWLPPGNPGNWWDNDPEPCDYVLKAPAYHYIRLLRISYEVIKTIDPTAFITVGGLGSESFLDVILRNTDNPVDGSISADYPLTGGAYFDAMSIHSYPHFRLRTWSNSCACFVYERHSDNAVEDIINHKNSFNNVLNGYGYDDTTYPSKPIIITETNIPNIPLMSPEGFQYIGSQEAQRNYAMKLITKSYENNIRHLAMYQVADITESPTNWYDACGFYDFLGTNGGGGGPGNGNGNGNGNNGGGGSTPSILEAGIGTKTFTELIGFSSYDAGRTQQMNLPTDIDGAAFLKATGEYVYVLWAKTQTDLSELATANYSFPSNLGITSLEKKDWDYSNSQVSSNIAPTNIALTGAPTFFEESIMPLPVELILFEANRIEDKVKLKWLTASERNNSGFEIQRSTNGIDFERIGFVEGLGDSNNLSSYDFFDNNPFAGLNYYQLKQIDFDGSVSFSSIKSVAINDKLTIYPNPTTAFLWVENAKGKVIVFNHIGQVKKEVEINHNGIFKIDVRDLEDGIYSFVYYSSLGEQKHSSNFVKY